MIVSVRDKRVAAIRAGTVPARFPANLMRATQQAVRALEAAGAIEDLRFPPSHRVEALRGDRVGQRSMRVSLQWRLCFRCTEHGAEDVEIVDYH